MGEPSSLDMLALYVIPIYFCLLYALVRWLRHWYLDKYFPEYKLEERSKKGAMKFYSEYGGQSLHSPPSDYGQSFQSPSSTNQGQQVLYGGQSLHSPPSAYGQSFQSPSSTNQGQQFFINGQTAGKVSNFKRLSPKSLLSPKREVSVRLNVPRDEWNDVKLIRRQELIELKRVYWGIENPDLKFNIESDLFKGDILPFERNDVVKATCLGRTKYSLNDMFWYHDQWYYQKNTHSLLSQVLCDPDHPLKAMERSKLYITSQCLLFFATGVYLMMQGYGGLGVSAIITQVICLYPFMVAVEYFLWYMYSCPCLQTKTKTACAASIYRLFEQCGRLLGDLMVMCGILFMISGLILIYYGTAYLNTSDDYILFTDRSSNVQEYAMIDWYFGERNPIENILEYAKENIHENFSPAYIAYYKNATWNKGMYFRSGTFHFNGTTLSYHDGPEEDQTLWSNILYYFYNSIFKIFVEFILIYIIQFGYWKKEPVAIFVFGSKILHLNEWEHQWKVLDWRDKFFSEDEDGHKKFPPEKVIWAGRCLKIISFYYEHKTFENVQLYLEKTIKANEETKSKEAEMDESDSLCSDDQRIKTPSHDKESQFNKHDEVNTTYHSNIQSEGSKITPDSNDSNHNNDQTESVSQREEETTSISLKKEDKGIFNSLFKKNNQVAPTREEIDATSQIEETKDTSTQEFTPEG